MKLTALDPSPPSHFAGSQLHFGSLVEFWLAYAWVTFVITDRMVIGGRVRVCVKVIGSPRTGVRAVPGSGVEGSVISGFFVGVRVIPGLFVGVRVISGLLVGVSVMPGFVVGVNVIPGVVVGVRVIPGLVVGIGVVFGRLVGTIVTPGDVALVFVAADELGKEIVNVEEGGGSDGWAFANVLGANVNFVETVRPVIGVFGMVVLDGIEVVFKEVPPVEVGVKVMSPVEFGEMTSGLAVAAGGVNAQMRGGQLGLSHGFLWIITVVVTG